jgi:broad specificity phosphatase PhoE
MEVYLIRHGQMEAAGGVERYDLNIINQYMTRRKEHGLTEKGVWEIGRAAEFLRPLNINALYSSDFIRARESAAIISETLGLENTILKGIGEVNAGMIDPQKSPLLQAMLINSNKIYQRHPDFLTN